MYTFLQWRFMIYYFDKLIKRKNLRKSNLDILDKININSVINIVRFDGKNASFSINEIFDFIIQFFFYII